MTEPLLRVTDLAVEFRTARGPVHALNGVSFDVAAGEAFGLVGETGCGKTVTGLSLLRLLPAHARLTRGDIVFDGRSLLRRSERELRALRGGEISMIFQDPATSLNPVFTVGQQIERVIREHLRPARGQARRLLLAQLEAVGLPDPDRIARAYPHQLSGGMQQRVMIAMALACRPRLLIADEPTTALDVTIQDQVLALLRALQQQTGIALLLITHNLGVVAEVCDRFAVLYAGRVAETGPAASLFASPQHPYTQGLLAAIPSGQPGAAGHPLTSIPGSVPADALALPGCAFAPRCPRVFEPCGQAVPPLFPVPASPSPAHRSACYLAAPPVPHV